MGHRGVAEPNEGFLSLMILVSSDATLEVNLPSIPPFVILRGASLHSNRQSGIDVCTLSGSPGSVDTLMSGCKRGETCTGQLYLHVGSASPCDRQKATQCYDVGNVACGKRGPGLNMGKSLSINSRPGGLEADLSLALRKASIVPDHLGTLSLSSVVGSAQTAACSPHALDSDSAWCYS